MAMTAATPIMTPSIVRKARRRFRRRATKATDGVVRSRGAMRDRRLVSIRSLRQFLCGAGGERTPSGRSLRAGNRTRDDHASVFGEPFANFGRAPIGNACANLYRCRSISLEDPNRGMRFRLLRRFLSPARRRTWSLLFGVGRRFEKSFGWSKSKCRIVNREDAFLLRHDERDIGGHAGSKLLLRILDLYHGFEGDDTLKGDRAIPNELHLAGEDDAGERINREHDALFFRDLSDIG